jgi:hypothetical protein
MSIASSPQGPRPAVPARSQRPRLSVIQDDHVAGRLGTRSRDGVVISCYVPADEWPEWTDIAAFTTVPGKGA